MKRMLLALALGLGVAAPSARGAEYPVYKVTAEGTGSFHHHERYENGDNGFERRAKLDFSWRHELPEVIFDPNGRGAVGPAKPAGKLTGTGELTQDAWGHIPSQGIVHTYGSCSGTPAFEFIDPEFRSLPSAPTQAGTRFFFRPGDIEELPASCNGDFAGHTTMRISPTGGGMLEQELHIPASAAHQRKIVRQVSANEAHKAACPRSQFTRTCEIDWTGTITFEHVRTERAPEPLDPLVEGACVVPKVKGLAVRIAKSRLAAAGCTPKVKRARHRKVKKGRVIKQSAKPGTRLASGATLTITVSRGRH